MRSGTMRVVTLAAGFVCLGLGLAGIAVPVLPTTPFLLLAAACFLRASPKMHDWLITHRHLGPYIHGFLEGGGLTKRAKRRSVLTLWPAMGISAAIILTRPWPVGVERVLIGALLVVALWVSWYILKKPTRPEPEGSG